MRGNGLEQLKKRRDVLCANFMIRYKEGKLQGLTGEFIVKLKEGTFFEDFEKLVQEQKCVILNENKFVKNQYQVSVSKNSTKTSLQLGNLFYETGLFEFSEPNFYYINVFNSNDPLLSN